MVLETARFGHISEDKMQEWNSNFDSIVDLSSIDQISSVGAQLKMTLVTK